MVVKLGFLILLVNFLQIAHSLIKEMEIKLIDYLTTLHLIHAMRENPMDVLACPYCKDDGFPLRLIVIEEKEYLGRSSTARASRPLCVLYCGFRGKFLRDLGDVPSCDECLRYEVVTGVLYCSRCGR